MRDSLVLVTMHIGFKGVISLKYHAGGKHEYLTQTHNAHPRPTS